MWWLGPIIVAAVVSYGAANYWIESAASRRGECAEPRDARQKRLSGMSELLLKDGEPSE
jgi:hypothetical protein